MKTKKQDKFEDDGRVIAPMNIEGMPWHIPKASGGGKPRSKPEKMTFRENLAFSLGVLKAIGLVTVVYMGALLLFILFCVYVWLK